jgi:integrase
VRHWERRVKKDASKHFFVQIAHQGRRHRFTWKETNAEAVAPLALALYRKIVVNGWEGALAAHKPESAKRIRAATIGELLAEVKATAGFKLGTITTYGQCLRQIAAEVAKIGDQPALDENGKPQKGDGGETVLKSRFDYRAGGRKLWQAAVDALPLDVLSAEAVQRWMLSYIDKAGPAPDARRRAENSASSLIRNARALFSEGALKFAKANLILPVPLPFSAAKLPKRGSTKYQSKIDAHALIAAAKKELKGAPFQIFVLALLCGLRKREIDLLIWTQVDFTGAQIRIERTEWFEPKSEDSIGTVDIDPELLALLRGWKGQASGPFVIESTRQPHHNTSRVNYRCEPSFETLYTWLRVKGVSANKPLHELRKELGALLASAQGIFAAQSVLRHAQISTTADYYTDKKRTITAGLGKLLVPTRRKKAVKSKI